MALEVPIPEWLDNNFVQTCLQDGDKTKKVEVITFKILSAVPPGNNFASCLWRLKVDFKVSEGNISCKSFIIKAPLTDGPVKEMHDQFSYIEPLFYNKYLPITYKILTHHHFAPKTYFSEYPNVLVLEDLNAKGYSMADRCTQLDFDQCKLYIKAAATMHAVSIKIYKEQPDLVKKLGIQKGFNNDLKSAGPIKMLVEKGLHYFAEKVESISEYKQYAELFHSLSSCIWDLLIEIHKPNDTLNALYQGDPWTANMMFRYDSSGKVIEIKLLDFQALAYASPVFDVIFFIWTSANDEVRESNLEELYRVYCNTINTILEECKCSERLSFEQLQETLQILSPYTVVVASCFYPFLINKMPQDMGALMTEIMEGKTNLMSEYYNEEFCKIKLPKLLKQLKSSGVFDYLKRYS